MRPQPVDPGWRGRSSTKLVDRYDDKKRLAVVMPPSQPLQIWSERENRDREEEEMLETDLALECAYIRNMSKEKATVYEPTPVLNPASAGEARRLLS
ncbi:hypothetical protein PoMZ_02436 [Pyricularia oryzae]|uniref:Uncharacterized protein n=1 Tax=Pyricularia oryzae TaxID=318829 RepID=A0A4P7NBB1_PYROR|nr:hypothetical protein PoMZ_02436 [Pyricularia oryzae]